MRKIAIIIGVGGDDYYSDKPVVQSITDWVDVTDEVFSKLQAAQYTYGYSVLERPIDPEAFITRTVQQWSDFLEEQAQKRELEETLRKQKLEQAKLNRLAKNRAEKLRLLNKLKEELGDV